MPTFTIIYTPGPNWIEDKPVWEQPLRPHGNYIKRLYDQQIALMGGPFGDNSGGMTIIEVESEADAQRIVDEDPAITEGIFEATLRPWFRVDWDGYQVGDK